MRLLSCGKLPFGGPRVKDSHPLSLRGNRPQESIKGPLDISLAPPPLFFFLLPFPSRNLFAQLSPTHRGNLSLSTEYKSVETSSTCSRRKRKEKRRNTYFLLSNDLDRTRFSKDEKIIEGISILFYSDRGKNDTVDR